MMAALISGATLICSARGNIMILFQVLKIAKLPQLIKDAEAEMKKAARRGLHKGGLIVQRQAQQWVPVDTGNLRGSAFTRVVGTHVEVGFSANYAIYVHENMEQKLKGQPRASGRGVYWGPDGRPKFLEAAWKAKREEFMQAVRNEVLATAKRIGGPMTQSTAKIFKEFGLIMGTRDSRI